MVSSPGNKGIVVNSSTITQAKANISIAEVDFLSPIRF
jgi:hypothetical protein